MAAAKPKPDPITKEGLTVKVEARATTTSVVMHVGPSQRLFTPDQARLLARHLRRAAAVLDPDPSE